MSMQQAYISSGWKNKSKDFQRSNQVTKSFNRVPRLKGNAYTTFKLWFYCRFLKILKQIKKVFFKLNIF